MFEICVPVRYQGKTWTAIGFGHAPARTIAGETMARS